MNAYMAEAFSRLREHEGLTRAAAVRRQQADLAAAMTELIRNDMRQQPDVWSKFHVSPEGLGEHLADHLMARQC